MNEKEIEHIVNDLRSAFGFDTIPTSLGEIEVVELECKDANFIKMRCSDKPKLIEELEDAIEDRENSIETMYNTRKYLQNLKKDTIYREDKIRRLYIEADLGIDDSLNEECLINKINERINDLNSRTIRALDKILESKEIIEKLKSTSNETVIKKFREIAEEEGLI